MSERPLEIRAGGVRIRELTPQQLETKRNWLNSARFMVNQVGGENDLTKIPGYIEPIINAERDFGQGFSWYEVGNMVGGLPPEKAEVALRTFRASLSEQRYKEADEYINNALIRKGHDPIRLKEPAILGAPIQVDLPAQPSGVPNFGDERSAPANPAVAETSAAQVGQAEERRVFENGFTAFTKEEIYELVEDKHTPMEVFEALDIYTQEKRIALGQYEFKTQEQFEKETERWEALKTMVKVALKGVEAGKVVALTRYSDLGTMEFVLENGDVLQVNKVWRYVVENRKENYGQRPFDVPAIKSGSVDLAKTELGADDDFIEWHLMPYTIPLKGVGNRDTALKASEEFFAQGYYKFWPNMPGGLGTDQAGKVWVRDYSALRKLDDQRLGQIKAAELSLSEYANLEDDHIESINKENIRFRQDDLPGLDRAFKELGEDRFSKYYDPEVTKVVKDRLGVAPAEPAREVGKPAGDPEDNTPEDRLNSLLDRMEQKALEIKDRGEYIIGSAPTREKSYRNAAHPAVRNQAKAVAQLIEDTEPSDRAGFMQAIFKKSGEVQDAIEVEIAGLVGDWGGDWESVLDEFRSERYTLVKVLTRAEDPNDPFAQLSLTSKLYTLAYYRDRQRESSQSVIPPQEALAGRLEEELVRQLVAERHNWRIDNGLIFNNLSPDGIRLMDELTKDLKDVTGWRREIEERLEVPKPAAIAEPVPAQSEPATKEPAASERKYSAIAFNDVPSFSKALEAQRSLSRAKGVKNARAVSFERGRLVIVVDADSSLDMSETLGSLILPPEVNSEVIDPAKLSEADREELKKGAPELFR